MRKKGVQGSRYAWRADGRPNRFLHFVGGGAHHGGMSPRPRPRPSAPTARAAPAALALPCTGQALRLALARRDLRALDALTRPLRVAGYRFDPLALAGALLAHGCAWVADAFGQRVPVHVRVPRPAAGKPGDVSPEGFVIAV